jgi:hypothetical protein
MKVETYLPIMPELPEGDPLRHLDLRYVIEHANKTCQHLQQVVVEKDREIAFLKHIVKEIENLIR